MIQHRKGGSSDSSQINLSSDLPMTVIRARMSCKYRSKTDRIISRSCRQEQGLGGHLNNFGNFDAFAGPLWVKARLESRRSDSFKTTDEQLTNIALALDQEAGYLPPADYLEGQYADEVHKYNSKNSNSREKLIMTWTKLVSVADPYMLRGMKETLFREAPKS